ncbi:hypothetical protein HGRIS_005625 [Hohenbuehelia grisea]|uniref:Acyltransferase MbtK/IucB-like conserved domain-containing protein n=1 Tax=Hohenbuehelia grisea TaxID=104357 RepID=A0ABR3JYD2_9AGAR
MNATATRRLLALQQTLVSGVNAGQTQASGKNRLSPSISQASEAQSCVLFLPNGGALKMAGFNGDLCGIAGEKEDEQHLITLDDIPLGVYKARSDMPPVALVLSSIGTPFQDKSCHVPTYPILEIGPPRQGSGISTIDLWNIIYFLFTLHHSQEQLPIVFSDNLINRSELIEYALSSGLGRPQPQPAVHSAASSLANPDVIFLTRMAFWQGAGMIGFHGHGWLSPIFDPSSASTPCSLPRSHYAFPYTPAFTRNDLVIAAHPLRPPKPQPGELLYKRYCPSIGKTLAFRYLCLDDTAERSFGHVEAFHRWHNSPRVNSGWGERGSLEQHRVYLAKVLADPAVLPVMMSWDGELMGYAEFVWVKENHMATYLGGGEGGTQARDWDRGIHVLAGEDKFKGRTFCE